LEGNYFEGDCMQQHKRCYHSDKDTIHNLYVQLSYIYWHFSNYTISKGQNVTTAQVVKYIPHNNLEY
jgi:hypothetical protein